MFNHILIPTDGSPLSTVAMEKSMAFARDAQAQVTVLAVIEPFSGFWIAAEHLSAAHAEHQRRWAEQAARSVTEAELRARALGLDCHGFHLEDDRPWRAIIDTAAERGCDLIAMGSHGRGGVSAVVVGSQTLKVLSHSSLPVLVFR